MGTSIKFNTETGEARDSDGRVVGEPGRMAAPPSPQYPGDVESGSMTGGEVTYLNGEPVVKTSAPMVFKGASISEYVAQAAPEDAILASAKSIMGSPVAGRRPVQADDLVEIEGSYTSVAAAVTMGYLAQDDRGKFIAVPAPDTGAADTGSSEPEENTPEIVNLGEDGEASMGELVTRASQGDQINALNSFFDDGVVSEEAINRLASSAGMEPEEVYRHVANIQIAYESKLPGVLAKEGVHDYEMFREWMWSDPTTAREAQSAIREMVVDGPASGFKGLAQSFTEALDTVDPVTVKTACEEAGIKVQPMPDGRGLLLTMPDGNQVPWSIAVKSKLFKVSRA